MLLAAGFFCASVFQLRSDPQLPSDQYGAAALFCLLLPFAFLFLAIQLGLILKKDHIFFAPAERNSWTLENFDTVQTLQIGPLNGIEQKNLVLKVRWQPLTEHIPRLKSFKLARNAMPVPTAKLRARLIGLDEHGEVTREAAKPLTKGLNPENNEGQVFYTAWHELAFTAPEIFPAYLLEIDLVVKFGYAERNTKIEQLQVELFVGANSRVPDSQSAYKASNIQTAAASLTGIGIAP